MNMTQLTENIFAIEVPGDAERIEFSIQGDGVPCITYWHGKNLEPDVVCLPPGSWSFLCTSTDITEEQCKEIVVYHEYSEGYEHYMTDEEYSQNDRVEPLSTALESFHSLLRSKGLGRVAIIKKV